MKVNMSRVNAYGFAIKYMSESKWVSVQIWNLWVTFEPNEDKTAKLKRQSQIETALRECRLEKNDHEIDKIRYGIIESVEYKTHRRGKV